MKPSKTQFLARYLGVNAVATATDYTVFLTLIHLAGAPVLESLAAYSVATLVNFKLTRSFVFTGASTGKSEERVFMEFMAAGILGLALTGGVIWLNAHLIGATPAVAKTVAVLVCTVVLYFVRLRLVFNVGSSPVATA
jgi:putative flippase GtrA